MATVNTVKSAEDELAGLTLEAKKLELLERQANLQDMTERLAERQMKRDNIKMRAFTNGATIRRQNQDRLAIQKRCNHRKGGDGAHGIVAGQGMDSQYAVIKHTFANGDMWVICLRCGKAWKPPMRKNFKTEEEYLGAVVEYKTACQFMTRNGPSTSSQFKWSDGGMFYRQSVENS